MHNKINIPKKQNDLQFETDDASQLLHVPSLSCSSFALPSLYFFLRDLITDVDAHNTISHFAKHLLLQVRILGPLWITIEL